MDTLDQLILEVVDSYKKEEKRLKQLPESERIKIENRNKLSTIADHEIYFAKEYPADAHNISLKEKNSRGKIIKKFTGDTTLFEKSKQRVLIVSLLFAITATILAHFSFLAFFISVIIGIILTVCFIYDIFVYKVQKQCFLEIYENSIVGMSEYGIVEVGYSDIKFIDVKYDPETSYNTPLYITVETTNKSIEFPYIHSDAKDAINEQKAMSIDNRKVFWSTLKKKYIDTFPDMCNI